MAGEQLIDGQAAVVAQAVEQCRPGPGIDLLAAGKYLLQAVEQARLWPWPMVHLQREAQQHEGIADHGRVEQVAPDTAKGLFADTDGNAGGDHRQPPRGQGRQGGRQQHGGRFNPDPRHGLLRFGGSPDAPWRRSQ
ncbi:hypothetical protein D9M73_208130 [compost metagenome]